MIAEADAFAAALAVGAVVEGDTAIAGGGQEDDAAQHLGAIAAVAVEQRHGAARTRWFDDPTDEAQMVFGLALQSIEGQVEVGRRLPRSATTGAGQPARQGVGRGKVADAGSDGQLGQQFGQPRRVVHHAAHGGPFSGGKTNAGE